MQVRKQQLELDMEQQTGSKSGKEYIKAVYCHPVYLTYMQSTSQEMLDWKKHTGIKIAGRNLNNLRYADDTILMALREEELKSLLMKMKEESEKVDLKLNIQESKIMASVPITSWQIDGETMETVTDFILGAPKSLQMVIAAMKLKMLAPWKKSYDRPRQHIKKQRHHFVNNGPSSQGYGFSSSHVWLCELNYKQN